MMEYYIGIDIGTSSAKSLLMDSAGKIIKTSARTYEISERYPGWKEIDPELWMQAVDATLSELLADIDSMQVMAVGVTGQMHTVVLMDEAGNPVRPALMWNDTRTASMLPGIKENIRGIEDISYIANIISTGSPAVNLLWVKENEPENFVKMKKFLIGPDYIVFRLTGKYQTDYCEASTSSLFDLRKCEWSSEARELFGFPEGIYPDVKGSGEIAGTILPEYQEKYHLNSSVKVIVGTGDNPAAAISTGCLAKNETVLSLGTSGVLMFPRKKVSFESKGKNILFSMDGEEISVLVQGVVQSCGSSMGWWVEKILQTKDYNGETENIDTGHLGEGSVLFYPHLSGDKTIYADPRLRGCFIGIGTDAGRKEMMTAVMEGICFAVKQLTEAMDIPPEALTDLKVTGGGSKNRVWMQILADVLNTSVIQLESNSGAGYGIALAAAAAVSGKTVDKVVDGLLTEKERFTPRVYNTKLYQKKYERYLRIYDAVRRIEAY